ncbi:hypothetical protein D3C80_1860840 [compost metagenome]
MAKARIAGDFSLQAGLADQQLFCLSLQCRLLTIKLTLQKGELCIQSVVLFLQCEALRVKNALGVLYSLTSLLRHSL